MPALNKKGQTFCCFLCIEAKPFPNLLCVLCRWSRDQKMLHRILNTGMHFCYPDTISCTLKRFAYFKNVPSFLPNTLPSPPLSTIFVN